MGNVFGLESFALNGRARFCTVKFALASRLVTATVVIGRTNAPVGRRSS